MSQPTVYLHIGYGKTATTSIQNFFRRNSEELEANGVLWAEKLWEEEYRDGTQLEGIRLGTPVLPWFITLDMIEKGELNIPSQAISDFHKNAFYKYKIDVDGFFERVKEKAEGFDKVIISSEDFSCFPYAVTFPSPCANKKVYLEQTSKFVDRCKEYLSGIGKVKVVVYLRRQDRYIESAYNQVVSSGLNYAGSIDDFISIHKYALRYDEALRFWEEAFGRENIIVRAFERQQMPDGVISAFLECIQYRADHEHMNKRIRSNLSASREVLEEKLVYNRFVKDFLDLNSQKRVQNIFDNRVKREGASGVSLLTPEKRIEILSKYITHNNKVARRYLASDSLFLDDVITDSDCDTPFVEVFFDPGASSNVKLNILPIPKRLGATVRASVQKMRPNKMSVAYLKYKIKAAILYVVKKVIITLLKIRLFRLFFNRIILSLFYFIFIKNKSLLVPGTIERFVKKQIVSALAVVLTNFSVSYRKKLYRQMIAPTISKLFSDAELDLAGRLLEITASNYFFHITSEEDLAKDCDLIADAQLEYGRKLSEVEAIPALFRDSGRDTEKEDGEIVVAFCGKMMSTAGAEVLNCLASALAERHYLKIKPIFILGDIFPRRARSEQTQVFHGVECYISGDLHNPLKFKRLFIEQKVDVALWSLPHWSMYLFFASRLCDKQVWLSQYLRPRVDFAELDGSMTLGGSGELYKEFNGKTWRVFPQLAKRPEINEEVQERLDEKYQLSSSGNKVICAFARVAKMGQKSFLRSVVRILKENTDTCFYYASDDVRDRQSIVDYFRKAGVLERTEWVGWLSIEEMVALASYATLILEPYPLATGSTAQYCSVVGVPIIGMYHEENVLYWRDILPGAKDGDPVLSKLCLDEEGRSIVPIINSGDEYVAVVNQLLADCKRRSNIGHVQRQAFDYVYFNVERSVEAFAWHIYDMLGVNSMKDSLQHFKKDQVSNN